MNRRSQFSLLIVRGDGERVLRFNFPRPAAVSVGVALAVIVSVTGVLVGDWVKLRELTRDAVTFNDQIQQQRATINTFDRRVAELRQEVSGWRELHAKIWEPLGPELAPGGRDRGIGGGTPTSDRAPARLSPIEELNRLGDSVKEQTDSLRALERLMARAGRMLASLPTRWPVRGSVNSESSTAASTSAPGPVRRSTRPPPAPLCTRAKRRTTAPRSCSTTDKTSARSTATCQR